ncbi:MAG: SCP2 sterol-binding domain-containing protein [Acidimicrobiia bacterium]|nr:SCP2 sterol-binding domain-containing protein [Acidimicrobiia bacterium]
MTEKHPFLADAWFEAVEGLISHHTAGTSAGPDLLVNMLITETPFASDRELHMGAQGGSALFASGHREGADVTLTTDYATAVELFVSGNPQAAMQAFMSGKVKVQGDMAKLMMAGQGGGGAPGGNPELTAAIHEVTATE